ncbi:MAG: CvpA family protein [Bacteroidales bacterium]|nr:CvpA family protein [Bacteroidales bacterium]
MNTLDIVILLLFLPGIIRGISKGFLEQVISIAGLVASVWAAYHFSSLVSERLKEYITMSETVMNVVAFTIVLVAALVVVLLIAKLLTKIAQMAQLGWINRLLGFAFSLLTSALIISVLIILFDTVNVKFELVTSPILEESILYGFLKDLGYLIFPYMKELLGLAS